MGEAILGGLSALTPELLLFMLLGVVVGQIAAVVPGLGGIVAMVLLLPIAYGLDGPTAIAMLFAATATSGTGNTITGVLFGVPGSSQGVVTVFDGYPMAKRGEAGRAISAGLTASAVGGLIGALALAFLIPIVRPIVQLVGPAEFFALVLIAMVAISSIGEGDTLRSLLAGGIGLLLAFVGQEPSTGTLRYTFGSLYLWDGLPLIPMIIGLYALGEMITLIRSGSPIAPDAEEGSGGGVIQGMRDVFVHWRITLGSSLVGVGVGILPGIGGVTAQFLAYAQARKQSKRPEMFGHGAVEGVIGSDAATNSVEGGALVPTLAFGIPGSAPMAILLGLMIIKGVQPGPTMLVDNLDIVWMLVLVLVLSNVVAVALCLSFTGVLARITRVSPTIIVPSVVVVSLFGAYLASNRVTDILVVVVFGFVGYLMQQHKYSRATLVIGLVLGGILEHNLLLASRLYGWSAVTRPPFLVIVGAFVVVTAVGLLRKRRSVPSKDLA